MLKACRMDVLVKGLYSFGWTAPVALTRGRGSSLSVADADMIRYSYAGSRVMRVPHRAGSTA